MLEHLTSWSDTPTKRSIVDFVENVTDPSSTSHVEPRGRVAVFDNDGTLWCEKPLAQGVFIAQRLAEMAREDPSLRQTQPWQAMYEGNVSWIDEAVAKHYNGDDSDVPVLAAAVGRAFADIEVEAFSASAEEFLKAFEHPVHSRPYTELGFVPMIELLEYLEAHDFTCFIVSGGGRDFMRPVTEAMYGIPADRVTGSSPGLHFVADDSGARIMRTATLGILDDGPTKPVQIWERIGHRPIFAAGNANGDVPMLQFATDQPGPSLALFVHHDDDRREAAYDVGADDIIERAEALGWTTVSMADDWNTVFARES